MNTLGVHLKHSLNLLSNAVVHRLTQDERLNAQLLSIQELKLHSDSAELCLSGITEIQNLLLPYPHDAAFETKATDTLRSSIVESLSMLVRKHHFDSDWKKVIPQAKALFALIDEHSSRSDNSQYSSLCNNPFSSLFIQTVYPITINSHDTIPIILLSVSENESNQYPKTPSINTTLSPKNFNADKDDVVIISEPLNARIKQDQLVLYDRIATNIPRTIDIGAVGWALRPSYQNAIRVVEFAQNIINHFVPPDTDSYPAQPGMPRGDMFDEINRCSYTALALRERFAQDFLISISKEGGVIKGKDIRQWLNDNKELVSEMYKSGDALKKAVELQS